MPVDRPTFSESWYRVAQLTPRLRSTVQIHRQHYRGQRFHVLQDPSSNQFFRLNEPAYQFVGLLDGRRSVAEAWDICNDQLGDAAPTQGETIQLLGQLYTSNLLHAELPPDAEGMFKRHRKRVQREVRGYLTNLLFIRIPLFDPDRALNRLLPVFGWVFSWVGLLLWFMLCGTGIYVLTGRWDELVDQSQNILNPEHLPLLLVSFWIIKVFHEFGHGLACKKFGRQAGSGGEVHTMGLMFLVFTPLPYVDTSSAWALPSKWQRSLICAAGMLVELAIASVAAIIWANASPGTLRAICYNVMFIASVSTLLFNANPLLRYDGYYILSDLIEIPNLSQRAKQYLYYLVKRYVWAVRNPRNPANTVGERVWFVFYGIASTVYRVFICIRILLFVTDRLPEQFKVFGAAMGAAAAVTWVLVPLGKLIHYLATSNELARTRLLAVTTTVLVFAAAIGSVVLIPVSDNVRVEGFLDPADQVVIHARTPGRVVGYLPTGRAVQVGDVLVTAESEQLRHELAGQLARREHLTLRLDQARQQAVYDTTKRVEIDKHQADLATLDQAIATTRRQIDELTTRSPIAGTWIAPRMEDLQAAQLKTNQTVGMVSTVDDMVIRALADQDAAPQIQAYLAQIERVDVRLKGNPDVETRAEILRILPAGSQQLPSQAMGYAGGGAIATDPNDPKGLTAAENVVEIRLRAQPRDGVRFWPRQRVVCRFHLPSKPLAYQWARTLRQLFLRKG